MIRASAATATGAAQGIHPAATRNLPAAAMRATSDRVESRRVICEPYEGGVPPRLRYWAEFEAVFWRLVSYRNSALSSSVSPDVSIARSW